MSKNKLFLILIPIVVVLLGLTIGLYAFDYEYASIGSGGMSPFMFIEPESQHKITVNYQVRENRDILIDFLGENNKYLVGKRVSVSAGEGVKEFDIIFPGNDVIKSEKGIVSIKIVPTGSDWKQKVFEKNNDVVYKLPMKDISTPLYYKPSIQAFSAPIDFTFYSKYSSGFALDVGKNAGDQKQYGIYAKKYNQGPFGEEVTVLLNLESGQVHYEYTSREYDPIVGYHDLKNNYDLKVPKTKDDIVKYIETLNALKKLYQNDFFNERDYPKTSADLTAVIQYIETIINQYKKHLDDVLYKVTAQDYLKMGTDFTTTIEYDAKEQREITVDLIKTDTKEVLSSKNVMVKKGKGTIAVSLTAPYIAQQKDGGYKAMLVAKMNFVGVSFNPISTYTKNEINVVKYACLSNYESAKEQTYLQSGKDYMLKLNYISDHEIDVRVDFFDARNDKWFYGEQQAIPANTYDSQIVHMKIPKDLQDITAVKVFVKLLPKGSTWDNWIDQTMYETTVEPLNQKDNGVIGYTNLWKEYDNSYLRLSAQYSSPTGMDLLIDYFDSDSGQYTATIRQYLEPAKNKDVLANFTMPEKLIVNQKYIIFYKLVPKGGNWTEKFFESESTFTYYDN